MKKSKQRRVWFEKFTQELFLTDPENYQLLLVNFFRLLGIPILTIFTVRDFLRGNTLEGFITAGALFVFLLSFWLLDHIKNNVIVYRTAILLLVVDFSLVIYAHPDIYVSALWMFLLPLPIAFLLGIREGAVWITFSLLSSLIAIRLSAHRGSLPEEFILRYTITYLLLGCLSLIVEVVRARGYSLFMQNQAELKALNQQLYENSIRDSLTGFYNRSYLSAPLEEIISHSLWMRSHLVIILFDVDNFKIVNDQCGHIVGDEVLVQISNAIRTVVKRKSDFIIRYGGDEFLIGLPDTTLEKAKEFASEIQARIGKLQVPNCKLSIQASFGLVELLNVSKTTSKSSKQLITTLIAIADKNLYEAKSSGGRAIVE